ncbi:extracellular protein [Fusarium longipes]|uniref:Extracellular protein n=1 Tax=Fusarium longipes TaxID=694270 RepID=A0A395S2E6_9HYPO|nr:extracellular protein [Fusarium longipes]
MRPNKSIAQLPIAMAMAVLLFSRLVLASPNPDNKLIQRDEEEGSGCSTEGQWHCMTNSFQRCAGGHWSMKMAMAEGTKCVPAGYTDDFNFRIEREGNDDDGENQRDENRNNNGGSSLGTRNSNSVITVAVASSLWVILEALV